MLGFNIYIYIYIGNVGAFFVGPGSEGHVILLWLGRPVTIF